MLKEGMFIQERYEIISKIGSGGMSDVYKAKDHKLNRYVAVKVLKPEFRDDKAFISKFRVEAQSAAGLAHPNIVNVYDVGDDNGIYFIVMELVEGITLKEYIEKEGTPGCQGSHQHCNTGIYGAAGRPSQQHRTQGCKAPEYHNIHGWKSEGDGFWDCQGSVLQYHQLQCDGFRTLQFPGTGKGRLQ